MQWTCRCAWLQQLHWCCLLLLYLTTGIRRLSLTSTTCIPSRFVRFVCAIKESTAEAVYFLAVRPSVRRAGRCLSVNTWLCVFVCAWLCESDLNQAYICGTCQRISTKFIEIFHYQVHLTLITFSRSWSQRSGSGSDGHRSVVNSIVRKPLNGTEPQPVFQLAPHDPGVKREKPGGTERECRAPKGWVSSAVGARIEAPRGIGCGPPPQKIFRFLSSKRRPFVHSGCSFCSWMETG